MAVVTFNRKDLESLIGKKLSDSDYKDRLPMLGTPMEKLTDEEVEFEVFPNRPDLLSVEGFARAAAGFLGVKKGFETYNVYNSRYTVEVDKKLLGIRGCAAFAVIKDIKFIDESIAAFMQLQEKLAATIGRKRKKVGLGAYDLRELRFPIKYVPMSKQTKFIPLGFTEELTFEQTIEKHPKGKDFGHLLKDWVEYPSYVDAKNRVMCLIPITQGEFSKITPETTDIFIEVTGNDWKAVFEILNITHVITYKYI